MCRSIHTLYHINPPASQGEIHAASLQYVRKISGFSKPSRANEMAFMRAVDDIEAISARLLAALETDAPVRARFTGDNTDRQGSHTHPNRAVPSDESVP